MKHRSKLIFAALTLLACVAHSQNNNVVFDIAQIDNGVTTAQLTSTDSSTTLDISNIYATTGNPFDIYSLDPPDGVGAEDGTAVFQTYDQMVMSFTFSQTVQLVSYRISLVPDTTSPDSNYSFKVGSGNWIDEALPSNMTQRTTYEFNNKLIIPNGSTLQIRTNNPNSGATNSVVFWTHMTVTPTTVPEPSTYALYLGCGAFLFIMIRHRMRD